MKSRRSWRCSATPPGDGLQDLTERDLEIMRLLAEGRSLAEIAEALGIGYKTVANACSTIKAKLGVPRRMIWFVSR